MTRPAAPAVVVGLDLNGLGVVRSLARGDVPVIGVDTDIAKPTARTRFSSLRSIGAVGGERLVRDLLSLAEELPPGPVLFLTKEETVATVSAARAQLAGAYRFVLPPAEITATLTDKHGFQALAERTGAAVPRAVRLCGPDDLASAQELTFPCVLKPNAHTKAYEAHFKKAYRVETPAELGRLYLQIHPVHPQMIVQEWIEGADGEIYFCLQYRTAEGKRIASFAGRKIRAWPPQTGGTASCTAAPEAAAELERATDAFFSATGCVGMAGMEFKRDRRSGRLLMVEPTVGRTDHQAEVATLNGVNLPLVAYNSLIGTPVPSCQPPAYPRIWRDPLADAKSAAAQGDATMPVGRVVDAYRRVDDPLPWIARHLERVTRRLGSAP